MMFISFIGSLFVMTAGVTLLVDDRVENDEIGKFFTGTGALFAVIFGVMMIRGAA